MLSVDTMAKSPSGGPTRVISVPWLNVAGLALDFVGVLLMAWDLVDRPAWPPSLGTDEIPELVYDVATAAAGAVESGDASGLRDLQEEANSLVLAHTADRSRAAGGAVGLRKRGRLGLAAVLLGFLLQLIAASATLSG